MPKVLSNAEHSALKQKADNYDNVVSALVSNNEGLTAEDVTPDVITEVLTASVETETEELQSQLTSAVSRAETAEARVEELTTEVEKLTTENNNLRGTPNEDTVTASVKSDADGQGETISQFANKNAGNTAAILEQAKKEGLI